MNSIPPPGFWQNPGSLDFPGMARGRRKVEPGHDAAILTLGYPFISAGIAAMSTDTASNT